MNRRNVSFLVTGLSSTLAFFLHAYLIWEFFQVKYAMGEGSRSLCSISEKFDCSVVAASTYGSLFGIPMAQFGLWSNLIFIILLFSYWLTFKLTQDSSSLVRFGLIAIAALLGLGTITMGSISLILMKTYCLFCIGTYICSVLTIAGTYMLLKSEVNGLFSQIKPVWLVPVILIPIGSWLTHAIIMDQLGGKKLPVLIQESILEWKDNPKQNFDYTNGVSYGSNSVNPSNLIVEFVDLFCPHCKFSMAPLKAFTKSRSDITLLVKLFPLDGSCNSAISSIDDGFRCKWSSAVVCATLIGEGQSVLNWIFENQAHLARASFEGGLMELQSKIQNINNREFTDCLSADSTLRSIQSMVEEGRKAGIKGTPSIFVNGRLLPKGQLMPILEAAIKTP